LTLIFETTASKKAAFEAAVFIPDAGDIV